MAKAQRVQDPSELDNDPDVFPWARRIKYVETSELLSDYRISNAELGRTFCPVTEYLAEHVDDDILDVEEAIYGHPEWGPMVLCESMHLTLPFNHAGAHPHGEAILRWVQHYLAINLIRRHPFERARGPLSAMLYHPKMRFASPGAAYVVLAYLNSGHPNPRRFLEKPAIRAKFPPDLEIARFAAPDFAGA